MRLIRASTAVLALVVAADLHATNLESFRSKIDKMVDSRYPYKILSVSDAIDGITVVALTPPYREFPNVLLFKHSDARGLVRVEEGLSLGIQDEQSPLLDLHTIGNAFDIAVDFGLGRPLRFADDQAKKLFSITRSSGLVPVLYGKFLHAHSNTIARDFYIIDKSQYKDFAVTLLGERYNFYPDSNCAMYDTPLLRELKFSRKGTVYYIEATTMNSQKWTVIFAGIDQDTRFLMDKNIAVEALLKTGDGDPAKR